jgi:hypothetical protein
MKISTPAGRYINAPLNGGKTVLPGNSKLAISAGSLMVLSVRVIIRETGDRK